MKCFVNRRLVAKPLLVSLMLSVTWVHSEVVSSPESEPIKAGAYYFDGWTGKTEVFHLPERLRGEFGFRRSVWGWMTSTPEVMRKQIDCAADHGLCFFAFDWYYPEGSDKETPVNNALELYQHAPNRDRMKFCIMATNHTGFRIGPKDWDACCKIWIKLFQSPLYLRVNGTPLIVIFSPQELIKSFGSPQEVEKAFEKLRIMALKEGFAGVSIAGCWAGRDINETSTLPKPEEEAGYTFATSYALSNECGWDWPKRDQPFRYLIEGNIKAWDVIASHTRLPYIPAATLGWDMRPWEKSDLPPDKQAIRFLGRTPAGVRSMISGAKQWISNNQKRTSREKILLLYAWNEYGEGAYLTPTDKEGFSYLDAVKEGLNSAAISSP